MDTFYRDFDAKEIESMFSPSVSALIQPTKIDRSQTVIPVTLRQLKSVEVGNDGNGQKFLLNGRCLHFFSFVSRVLSVNIYTGFVVYLVDDGTAIFKVIEYFEPDSADYWRIKDENIVSEYVFFLGTLMYQENDPSILSFKSMRVTDHNEIWFELLRALRVRQKAISSGNSDPIVFDDLPLKKAKMDTSYLDSVHPPDRRPHTPNQLLTRTAGQRHSSLPAIVRHDMNSNSVGTSHSPRYAPNGVKFFALGQDSRPQGRSYTVPFQYPNEE